MIHVKLGKGNVNILFFQKLLWEVLKEYWKVYQLISWLFQRSGQDSYLTTGNVEKILKETSHKIGITKNTTVNTLRYSFATYLLEDGVNLKYIQELL